MSYRTASILRRHLAFATIAAVFCCHEAHADQLVYVAFAQPCRIVETRTAYNVSGAMLESATSYVYGTDDASIRTQTGNAAASCGIPADAYAIGVNLLMLDATDSGNLKAWAGDPAYPPAASIAVFNPAIAEQSILNGAFANILLNDGRFCARAGHASINLVMDVLGFWRAATTGTATSDPRGVAFGYNTNADVYSIAFGDESSAVTYGTAFGFANQAGHAGYAPATAMGALSVASGDYAAAIGYSNKASGKAATAMSVDTEASGDYSTALGDEGTAAGNSSTAAGYFAVANGDYAVALGGNENMASGKMSTAIGNSTVAAGEGSVAMGYNTNASGKYAVAMGYDTTASSPNTVAMGYNVVAGAASTFVYGDGSAQTVSGTTGRFAVRASGGFKFLTSNGTSGVSLAANSGSWASLSDRNAKDSATPIDARVVLARVAALPLSTWHYKTQDERFRHMGPMAQDFHEAFGLGESDSAIATVDADGVALAAIQGLAARVQDEASTLRSLHEQMDDESAKEDLEFEQLRSSLSRQSAHLDAAERAPGNL